MRFFKQPQVNHYIRIVLKDILFPRLKKKLKWMEVIPTLEMPYVNTTRCARSASREPLIRSYEGTLDSVCSFLPLTEICFPPILTCNIENKNMLKIN